MFIVLIPNVSNPNYLTQFHMISLCIVIFKIISEVHANRLKKILPRIISPEQSALYQEGSLLIMFLRTIAC